MKTFLEIGSCDFNTLNYLSDKGWRGVIVEPIKKYLNNLEQKPNVHYLNYAVDSEVGQRSMFLATEDTISEDGDYAGMSSFYQWEDALSNEVVVNTTTFDRILTMCDITHIDFLKIDTEGHDFELIKLFPFDRIQPQTIQAEVKYVRNLMGSGDDMIRYIEDKGYHVIEEEENLIAIRL